MNFIPSFSTTSAKAGFSERNPYPGCTASQPVTSAAAMRARMSR